MSITDPESDQAQGEEAAYRQNVEDYAAQASEAADNGNFATAASIWESILADEDMSSLFAQETLSHMRSRVDWARGFESATDKVYTRAAEHWAKVVAAGHLNEWYGSTGDRDLRYNLALAYTLAREPQKATEAMSDALSEDEKAEILAATPAD